MRWLWRGALNGAHRGDSVSTRDALDRIDPDSEEQSVQGILEMVKQRPTVLPDVADPFNFRFAASKLQALAIMEFGPRDLEKGTLLHLGAFLDNVASDRKLPFPAVIASISGRHTGCVQSVANRLAHPSRAGLRGLLLSVTDRDVLASHGITEAAIQALRNGVAEQFLNLREEYLRPHFQDFFERHARWDEPDRPSLASLLVADEED